MDLKQFSKEIERHARELDHLARERLPVKVAAKAEEHYRDNFDRGGFMNNGNHPWKTTRRQMSGGKGAGYGPLLSGRAHLKGSVTGTHAPYRARAYNDVPYAAIHNFGGTVHPAITPKMRRFGWAKYHEAGGKDNPSASGKWKGLALTRKKRLDIAIPQRQFIGRSAELEAGIRKDIDREVEKIMYGQ